MVFKHCVYLDYNNNPRQIHITTFIEYFDYLIICNKLLNLKLHCILLSTQKYTSSHFSYHLFTVYSITIFVNS